MQETSSRSNFVRISYIRKSQSIYDRKKIKLSNRQKKSKIILHVNIKSSKVSKSRQHLSSISNRSTKSTRVTDYQIKPKLNITDENGVVNEHHHQSKQKKKQCSRRQILAISLGIIILMLVILTILLVLLLKSKVPKTYTVSPVLRWNSTGITVAGSSGNPGNANNQLRSPFDVLVDEEYNLYIADYRNHRIQKYTYGSSTGTTVAGNGTSGSSPYQLYDPSRVIMDTNKNLYIAEISNNQIRFWPYGSNTGNITMSSGVRGNATNQLWEPYGIALDPSSNILYVAERLNHRLISFTFGAQNGTVILGGNGAGLSTTQLFQPFGLYFDSYSKSLLVANNNANNIVRVAIGSTNWTLVVGSINGTSGTTSTRFRYPIDVKLDPMGNLYVADDYNHRVQFFYNGQSNGSTIAGITGVNASNASTLSYPRSIALDNQLNLYVVDHNNHRVQKFFRY